MDTLSCLLPSSSHFHLPQVRHRHTALDTNANADALALASAIDALPGSPNATITGQPNGLVVVKKAVACKCRQYLPRTPNATAYGLFNDYLGIILDLAMLRKCINVSTSGGPNTTAIGLLNDRLGILPWTHDASQVHHYISGLLNTTTTQAAQWCAARPDRLDHLKIKLLKLLQPQMPRKSVNAPGSSPNAANKGSSMIPSTSESLNLTTPFKRVDLSRTPPMARR
ncbi:hypothetical protein FB107DRAFT_273682 [Schizophyllum commune]